MKDRITSFFKENGLDFTVDKVENGPRITKFTITPSKGRLINKFLGLKYDLMLTLGLQGVRMIAPIPGTSQIEIEIPNERPETVRFSELSSGEEFTAGESITAVCLGRDAVGNAVIADISRMPHLLVAGATATGKSVAIHSMIAGLLLKADPDRLKLMLIDPKQVEFTAYNGIPHLITPIIHDAKAAAAALDFAVNEMERRYSLLMNAGVRNINDYNRKTGGDALPYIVIIIDELADLMLCERDSVEMAIVRLAQKARAAGIHLIIGTQRPVPSVITSLIKVNIPSRLCCKVACRADSRTVLDLGGAEDLLGKGDALYISPSNFIPLRIQCPFISDEEIDRIAGSVKEGRDTRYDGRLQKHIEHYFFKCANPLLFDRDFREAVELVISKRRASISLLRNELEMGYVKGSRFIEKMEELGIVGPLAGNRPREILITVDEWQEMLEKIENR